MRSGELRRWSSRDYVELYHFYLSFLCFVVLVPELAYIKSVVQLNQQLEDSFCQIINNQQALYPLGFILLATITESSSNLFILLQHFLHSDYSIFQVFLLVIWIFMYTTYAKSLCKLILPAKHFCGFRQELMLNQLKQFMFHALAFFKLHASSLGVLPSVRRYSC